MPDHPDNYRPPLVGHVVTAEELERLADAILADTAKGVFEGLNLLEEIRKRPRFHRVGF